MQNLSTLIAEVATFGFDELMIENVIKELVPAGAAKGRIFGAQGLSDTQAKFAQEYLKGSGAKLFEKAAQNMVEGSSFPTADQLLARAGHAFAAAGLKAVSAKILTSPTVFTPTAERFRENLKKIILNGPPPKAAIGYAMAKELTDMLASPDWGNTTLQEKLARVTKAGLDLGRERGAGGRGVHEPRRARGDAGEEAREVATPTSSTRACSPIRCCRRPTTRTSRASRTSSCPACARWTSRAGSPARTAMISSSPPRARSRTSTRR